MIASIRQPILIVCLALLIAPLLAIVTAPQRISHDEATALWVARDFDEVFGVAPRDAVTNAVSNLRDMAHRVQEQPQPPLYFFLLDSWTTVLGDSLVSARTLSFALALMAIAVVAIAGKKRALWLVAANAFALPAAEIYLYSLLLLLSTLAYLAFTRWRNNQNPINSVLYIMTLILLWYTSFAALPQRGATSSASIARSASGFRKTARRISSSSPTRAAKAVPSLRAASASWTGSGTTSS
jgi:hypothetical protein